MGNIKIFINRESDKPLLLMSQKSKESTHARCSFDGTETKLLVSHKEKKTGIH